MKRRGQGGSENTKGFCGLGRDGWSIRGRGLYKWYGDSPPGINPAFAALNLPRQRPRTWQPCRRQFRRALPRANLAGLRSRLARLSLTRPTLFGADSGKWVRVSNMLCKEAGGGSTKAQNKTKRYTYGALKCPRRREGRGESR